MIADALPRRQQPDVAVRGTSRRLIRPPDPAIKDLIERIGSYRSDEATRRYLHLAFRDAYTVLDLTYARGGFWRGPLPPGITLTTSNIDPEAKTDLHLDFTATELPDASYDVVIIDPPHLASMGPNAILRRRFGTVRGRDGLEHLIRAGIREAWRVCRIGILIKLTDHGQSNENLALTLWAQDALNVRLYWSAHTYRPPVGGKTQSVGPRCNNADWLIYRRDGHRWIDFKRRYERQEALRLALEKRAQKLAKTCAICNVGIGDRRGDAATCSPACRQKAHRRRLALSRET